MCMCKVVLVVSVLLVVVMVVGGTLGSNLWKL
jgi:hypothetical protein